MNLVLKELYENNIGKVLVNEPLKKYTTINVGGPADVLIQPNSIDHLIKTVSILSKHYIPIRVIGRGSNLLIPDSGIRGAVIQLGRGLDHLIFEGEKLRVGGGYPLIGLAAIVSKKGLSGLEFAGGIPGSVGGAVYMNAGAHGSDISNILVKAHILYHNGCTEWLTKEEMKFDYRKSVLQGEKKGYCIEAVFQLKTGVREKIVEEMKKHKDYRRNTQPWDYPCAGSIFRNPLPNYAGQLIEELGLKGYHIGGAKISDLHGNFIVNEDDASYEDVISLIKYIQLQVKEKYNIALKTEIEILK